VTGAPAERWQGARVLFFGRGCNTFYAPPIRVGGIKRWCASDDVCRLSDVCRVHREYSGRPQLLEARRAGRRRRKGWIASGLQRSAYSGRGHIVSPRAQLVLWCVVSATVTFPAYAYTRCAYPRKPSGPGYGWLHNINYHSFVLAPGSGTLCLRTLHLRRLYWCSDENWRLICCGNLIRTLLACVACCARWFLKFLLRPP